MSYNRERNPSRINMGFEIFDDSRHATSTLSPGGLTLMQTLREAEQYQQHIANATLPAIPIIPIFDNLAYAAHNSRLPANICFQVKIVDTARVQQTYPTAIAGQTVRLYYPDYQSFQRIVQEGLIQMLGIPGEGVIIHLKIVAKKCRNNIITKELNFTKEDWDNTLTELRAEGIGGKVGEGLGSSHKVKLFISLA